MASVVVSQEMSGQGGALHLTLEHAFRLATGHYFLTHDRAVCAPAGPSPATCRVNDVLTIAEGTGSLHQRQRLTAKSRRHRFRRGHARFFDSWPRLVLVSGVEYQVRFEVK